MMQQDTLEEYNPRYTFKIIKHGGIFLGRKREVLVSEKAPGFNREENLWYDIKKEDLYAKWKNSIKI